MGLPLWEAVKSAASGILEPAIKLVDELHTSGEEKMAFEAQKLVLKAQIMQARQDYEARLYQAETERLQSQHAVQVAEQTNGNLLSRSWRPIVGLQFVATMFLTYGLPGLLGRAVTVVLPEEYWYSNMAILGVAIAGRSAERIARTGKARAKAAES